MKSLAEKRIVIDSKVCSGKPHIKGTRVSVADIILAYAEGLDVKDILRSFRTIREEDIDAALAYAYCVTDGVELDIMTKEGKKVTIENDFAYREDVEQEAQDVFNQALEEEAAKQEEITQQKIEKLKAKKEKERGPKQKAPDKRAYDLEIILEDDAPVKVFSDKDQTEQGLDMEVDNYIFESRADGAYWLTYSVKDDIEIDKTMRRNIKLVYQGKEAIFEGYLTNDRLNKVFIQKDEEGSTLGRVL